MNRSVFVLALLILASACSQINPLRGNSDVKSSTNADKVRVGVFLSLTGATAGYGISSLNSFKLATEEVNGAGGGSIVLIGALLSFSGLLTLLRLPPI